MTNNNTTYFTGINGEYPTDENGNTIWNKGTTNNMYSFNNFNRRGPLTANFMKFVESCEVYGKPATKRGYYKLIGKSLVEFPSNNNTFFHAIREAGIVKAHQSWNGKFTECVYTKGPNWDTYLDNNLRCNNR